MAKFAEHPFALAPHYIIQTRQRDSRGYWQIRPSCLSPSSKVVLNRPGKCARRYCREQSCFGRKMHCKNLPAHFHLQFLWSRRLAKPLGIFVLVVCKYWVCLLRQCRLSILWVTAMCAAGISQVMFACLLSPTWKCKGVQRRVKLIKPIIW